MEKMKLYASCNEPGTFCLVTEKLRVDRNDLEHAGCHVEYSSKKDPVLKRLERILIERGGNKHYLLWDAAWFSIYPYCFRNGELIPAIKAAKIFMRKYEEAQN